MKLLLLLAAGAAASTFAAYLSLILERWVDRRLTQEYVQKLIAKQEQKRKERTDE